MKHVDEAPVTTYTTILGLILKEIRFERKWNKHMLARAMGMTTSQWTSVENGESDITADTICRFMTNMGLLSSTSWLFMAADRVVRKLLEASWIIVDKLETQDNDTLHKAAKEFYKTEQMDTENSAGRDTLNFTQTHIPEVFTWATERAKTNNKPIKLQQDV